jgi:hypothetical protein
MNRQPTRVISQQGAEPAAGPSAHSAGQPAHPVTEAPAPAGDAAGTARFLSPEVVAGTVSALLARHQGAPGEARLGERVRRGVEQAAQRWWPEDGGPEVFTEFCLRHFIADPAALEAVFQRMERVAEELDGRLHEIRRELTSPLDLESEDGGPPAPFDELLAGIDLAPHLEDDLFGSKVAFLLLLNFPVHTLAERLEQGAGWDRAAWARSRMMDRLAMRVPAAMVQDSTRAHLAADQYIAAYNIRLDRVITPAGRRLFPDGLRLISHWGLRDELAAYYAAGDRAAALERQRTIFEVMRRIVRQEIPAQAIDNPALLWEPFGNRVWKTDGAGSAEPALPAAGLALAEGDPALAAPEPDTRYAHLLAVFRCHRRIDAYSPSEPTFIARRFERERQIPEPAVEALLAEVLGAPEVARLARLIARRLGRPLEPFDIWYAGFKPRGRHGEAELDRAVCDRYPTVAAFAAALPEILGALGFAPDKARWLADHIVVDAARGAGHALAAVRRADRAHLRTRVPGGGMSYKGYNVALHELGHNVEQVFSLNGIDHWWLAGVPNNAFTEAFAFTFQARDLDLLGMAEGGPEARRASALATLWNTYEISGVSLVDMRVWHWMYEHPDASPAELRSAVLAIAREVWNRWFLPRFGAHTRDSEALAVYSHMIAHALYLPDYAIGHIIGAQVGERMEGAALGAESERLARLGRLTPAAWMEAAVGEPISARALLAAARAALDEQEPPRES